jgi:hypothetical protein
MLTITPKAGSFLSNALDSVPPEQQEAHCFRLAQSDDGRVTLSLGKQTEEDLALVHEDKTVLVVDRQLAGGLEGRRVDLQDDGKGGEALVLS